MFALEVYQVSICCDWSILDAVLNTALLVVFGYPSVIQLPSVYDVDQNTCLDLGIDVRVPQDHVHSAYLCLSLSYHYIFSSISVPRFCTGLR